jgi:hypothetical protein
MTSVMFHTNQYMLFVPRTKSTVNLDFEAKLWRTADYSISFPQA